jgi:hypothetical protein
MRTRIYTLILVLLGLRVLELYAELPLTWHRLAQIALIVAMYSVVVAWFRAEPKAAQPALEQQPVMMPQRTNRRH